MTWMLASSVRTAMSWMVMDAIAIVRPPAAAMGSGLRTRAVMTGMSKQAMAAMLSAGVRSAVTVESMRTRPVMMATEWRPTPAPAPARPLVAATAPCVKT